MRRFFLTILSIAVLGPAAAQQAPVLQAPLVPGQSDASGMTIATCLGILTGLNALDGRRVVVAAGRSTEAVETVPYKFPGRLRDAVSHNIFILGQVSQEAQAASRRAQLEIAKGEPIRQGSRENIEFDQRMFEYAQRPCRAELDRVRDADLNLDLNDIAPSVLALLYPIRER